MKRPSSASTAVITFWVVYGVVAAWALNDALSPLKRELVLVLGGAGAILVVVTFALLFRARSSSSRHRGAD
jgi:hypothetical protein